MQSNYDVIEERYAMIYDKYIQAKDIDFSNEECRAYIDISASDEKIAAFEHKNRISYVNSRYDALTAAQVWAEQFKGYNPKGIIVLLGLGNGMHIRELLKVIDKQVMVLVLEPSIEMFNLVMKNIDISDILRDVRVCLSVKGLSDSVYLDFLKNVLDYGNMRITEIYSLPNYDRVYQETYIELFNAVKSAAELIVLDRNTHIKYSGQFVGNMLRNYKDIVEQYTINELKKQFDKEDISNVPAIIVSAGPSLDKNVHDLKEAEGKAFIIVVDTALKPVLNAGIQPDISIIVDPHKPLFLFKHDKIKDVPMVASHSANHKVLELQEAKRFYFGDSSQYISYICRKYSGISLHGLESGGSVANNAFSLAQYLGFKTIILVGQDLAFKGEQSHASSAYTERVDKKYMTKCAEEVEVEGIDGNMVSTMKNMELYLKWFEQQIAIHKELKVIDATEGGAKKKGALIMTLKEAIETECNDSINCREIIDRSSPTFSPDKREKVYEEFKTIPDKLNILKKRLDDGVRDYYRFEELYRKGKTNTSEFARSVEKITNANSLIDNEPLSNLIAAYNAKDNFEVIGDVFDFKKDEKEEIKAIVDKGVKMMNSYKKAIDDLLKDIPILLNSL